MFHIGAYWRIRAALGWLAEGDVESASMALLRMLANIFEMQAILADYKVRPSLSKSSVSRQLLSLETVLCVE